MRKKGELEISTVIKAVLWILFLIVGFFAIKGLLGFNTG